jgi:hypothetical protein
MGRLKPTGAKLSADSATMGGVSAPASRGMAGTTISHHDTSNFVDASIRGYCGFPGDARDGFAAPNSRSHPAQRFRRISRKGRGGGRPAVNLQFQEQR